MPRSEERIVHKVRDSDSTAFKVALAVVPALIALCGVLIGAHFHSVSNKEAADYSKLNEIRLNSYVEFMNAQRSVERYGGNQNAEAELVREQAAVRIAIYGDEPVVHAIAEAWRAGGLTKQCSTGLMPMLSVYGAMRRQVFGAMPGPQARMDIAEVIYGCKIVA